MRTLYTKFIIYTIGIMLLSFTLTFLIINTVYHQQFKKTNDEKNVAIAQNITSFIEKNESLTLEQYLNSVAQSGYKLFVVHESHTTQSFGEPFRKENLPENALEHVLAGNIYHGMQNLPKETFVTGLFADELANTVGVPFTFNDNDYALFLRPNIKMLFTEIHYLLGGLFIGMGIISLLAMLIVAKMLINPITKLTTATKKVSREQFLVDLPINRHDEIGQLAQSFQKMTDELREADDMRKQFISNVSHDFQTPLLNIKGYTDLLKNDTITEDIKNNYLHIIDLEVERLSSLTKQLLLLTSLDQLSTIVNKRSFSLTNLLKDTIYTYQWLLHEKNISLSFDADDIIFNGDKALLENVFDNLLSNAIKYTDDFGLIHISLGETEREIILKIEDSGVGIDEYHIPHLFDRFYRVDESRNEQTEGTGLGLSIVQQVIHLHNGQVSVTSDIDIGSTFSVILPKL